MYVHMLSDALRFCMFVSYIYIFYNKQHILPLLMLKANSIIPGKLLGID